MAAGTPSNNAQPKGALVNLKSLLVAVAALAASYAWTAHNSRFLIRHWKWGAHAAHPPTMIMAQVISVPLMTLAILACLQAMRHPSRRLLIPLFYALWFATISLSVAPGVFSSDTFYTFHMVSHGWWSGWYSPFHPAFMTALVQIIPSLSIAPCLALALLWAAVFTSVHRTLFLLDANRWLHFLLPLVLLLPSMLAASIIMIRDCYVAALFIALLNFVFRAVALRDSRALPSMLLIGVLAGVVGCYRTDMLPSAALAALVIAVMAPVSRWPRLLAVPTTAATLLLPFAAVIVLVHAIPRPLGNDWQWGGTWEPRAENEYRLTLIENPLGYIILQPSAHVRERDREAIEKVFKFSDLARYHCASNLCLFYSEHWRHESTEEDRKAAFKAAIHVFKHNPGLFLQSRLATLAEVGDANLQTSNDVELRASRGYPAVELTPMLTSLGQRITHYVTETEGRDGRFGGSLVWWNIYLWLVLCLLPLVSVRKTPASAIFAVLITLRSVFVFLAAPASFTTYYLPSYVGGPMLLLLWAAEFRTATRRKQNEFRAVEHKAKAVA